MTFAFGQAILEAADRRAQRIVDAALPAIRYGTVASLDGGNKATVTIAGQGSPGFAYPPSMRISVGDRVRVIILPTGDRYIDAAFGASPAQLHGFHFLVDAGDLQITTAANVVPGLTLTQATRAGFAELWVVRGYVHFRNISAGAETYHLRSHLDAGFPVGTPSFQHSDPGTADVRRQLVGEWAWSVAAGTHTVDVRCLRAGSSGSAAHFVDGDNVMTVTRYSA